MPGCFSSETWPQRSRLGHRIRASGPLSWKKLTGYTRPPKERTRGTPKLEEALWGSSKSTFGLEKLGRSFGVRSGVRRDFQGRRVFDFFFFSVLLRLGICLTRKEESRFGLRATSESWHSDVLFLAVLRLRLQRDGFGVDLRTLRTSAG